jgi:hypothetical protein
VTVYDVDDPSHVYAVPRDDGTRLVGAHQQSLVGSGGALSTVLLDPTASPGAGVGSALIGLINALGEKQGFEAVLKRLHDSDSKLSTPAATNLIQAFTQVQRTRCVDLEVVSR